MHPARRADHRDEVAADGRRGARPFKMNVSNVSGVLRVIIFAAFATFLFAGDPRKPVPTVNSLGMKFVPVGDVQVSVYLTTVANFGAFAKATQLASQVWRNPGFKQGPDHPVVNVTWREADAFCRWLTAEERRAGLLKSNELYRLPSDLEWSKAVGLSAETGATPEERDMGVQDVYPWGKEWPPPHDAGNYAGVETQSDIPIPGHNDGFPNTSPVGKFRVNAFGLYDMGGNVWQWVSDDWNSEKPAKTTSFWQWVSDFWKPAKQAKALRGASWYNGAIPLSLLSSCRISSSPDTLHDTYGFRIVKVTEPRKWWWLSWKSSGLGLFVLLLLLLLRSRARARARQRVRADGHSN